MRQRPEQSEDEICAGFVTALRDLETYNQIINPEAFMWFHIPNGQRAGGNATSRAIAGARDKRLGALRGVPDYCFHWSTEDGTPWVGYLEAKTLIGTLSPEQKAFRAYCLKTGVPFDVFRTVQRGLQILQSWGIIKQGAVV
jgi:hypothetical protein